MTPPLQSHKVKMPESYYKLLEKLQKAPQIKVKPKHWYQYLSPKWWKYKKIVEQAMQTVYENTTEQREMAMRDVLLYGVPVDVAIARYLDPRPIPSEK